MKRHASSIFFYQRCKSKRLRQSLTTEPFSLKWQWVLSSPNPREAEHTRSSSMLCNQPVLEDSRRVRSTGMLSLHHGNLLLQIGFRTAQREFDLSFLKEDYSFKLMASQFVRKSSLVHLIDIYLCKWLQCANVTDPFNIYFLDRTWGFAFLRARTEAV